MCNREPPLTAVGAAVEATDVVVEFMALQRGVGVDDAGLVQRRLWSSASCSSRALIVCNREPPLTAVGAAVEATDVVVEFMALQRGVGVDDAGLVQPVALEKGRLIRRPDYP